MSVCLSVRQRGTTRLPLEGFWWNLISEFFENMSRKFKFHWNPIRVTGTVHEDVFTFVIISRWILLWMRNVLDKSCRENENTYFMFNNRFFRKSCRLWDNVEKYGGDWGATNDVTIWRIRVACWINKATCTPARTHARTQCKNTKKHIKCIAFPRASLLRFTYIVCLVKTTRCQTALFSSVLYSTFYPSQDLISVALVFLTALMYLRFLVTGWSYFVVVTYPCDWGPIVYFICIETCYVFNTWACIACECPSV